MVIGKRATLTTATTAFAIIGGKKWTNWSKKGVTKNANSLVMRTVLQTVATLRLVLTRTTGAMEVKAIFRTTGTWVLTP